MYYSLTPILGDKKTHSKNVWKKVGSYLHLLFARTFYNSTKKEKPEFFEKLKTYTERLLWSKCRVYP